MTHLRVAVAPRAIESGSADRRPSGDGFFREPRLKGSGGRFGFRLSQFPPHLSSRWSLAPWLFGRTRSRSVRLCADAGDGDAGCTRHHPCRDAGYGAADPARAGSCRRPVADTTELGCADAASRSETPDDVARYKYPAVWVPVTQLYEAALAVDDDSGLARGLIVIGKP